MKKNNEALTSQLTQVAFHTLVTMMKAGPGSTHSEMMKVLFSFKNNGVDLEAYAKVCYKTGHCSYYDFAQTVL